MRTSEQGLAEGERRHRERVAVFAVATAYELGARGDDLDAVRDAVESQRTVPDEAFLPVLEIAKLFDRVAYLEGKGEEDGLNQVRDSGFDARVVDAFLKVQPLIQPVLYA